MKQYRTKKVEPAHNLWLKETHNEAKEKNIYNSLKSFLCISQFLGILPLDNILKGRDEIRFRWVNIRVVYSFCYIACLMASMVFCTASGFDQGYDMLTISNQVFYAGSLVNLLLYLRLAMIWPTLIKKWCSVDEIMNKRYGYPKGLDVKIKLFSMLYLSLSIGDHLLSVSNRYYGLKHELKENYTAAQYYNKTFGEMLEYLNYSLPLGIYTSVITTHANFSWAFNDLFIIIMSILLASRFRQVCDKISQEYELPNSQYFWQEIRKDYDRLSHLCSDLNSSISLIILLSYFQNICFILVQLYHSLAKFDNVLEKIYFVFSCCYLLFKTVSVSLYAASINDESKAPARYLNNVPSQYYNPEIKRLLIQISFYTVVLSGCKMFKITRGLVLSIATAIVTYELLLIQLTSVLIVDQRSKEKFIGPQLN